MNSARSVQRYSRVTFIQRESRTTGGEIIAEEIAKVHCAFIHTLLSREARKQAERDRVVPRCRLWEIMKLPLFRGCSNL